MSNWRDAVQSLADELTLAGKIVSPRWREVFCSVPRHLLVPEIYAQNDRKEWAPAAIDSESLIREVYSDVTLITKTLSNSRGIEIPVSSSTKPGLMMRMLEILDVEDGMRVLEIGTGSGYNAALLSERLGSGSVYSVDIRPDLVDLARSRLASIGYSPTLVTSDGFNGLPSCAPYDRIIVTCGVSSVPHEWIRQLAAGGLILVDLEGPLSAGNLILLRRQSEKIEASGQFLPWIGRFMPMRRDAIGAEYHLRAPQRDQTAPVVSSASEIDPAVLDHEFRLFAQVHLPSGTFHTLTAPLDAEYPTHTRLVSPDGSWAEVSRSADDDGLHSVEQAGSQLLWGYIENAHREWTRLGAPAWSRFGASISPHRSELWLDAPRSSNRWALWE